MHRQIVYSGAIPLDTDQLNQNKNVMIGLGMALQAIVGTATLFDGLTCTPTGPASLQVLVAPGSVYSFQNVDGTAYGSVGSDTTHQIIKQGISLGTLTLNCPAPGTTGQSINYLIQSAYQDADTGATVLPYYNSSNPAVAYNGPGNSGTSQNTVRQGQCIVNVKVGVAATTGSQVTPAPDAGYTGLWVVTVTNSQTTITSGNIVLASGAPFISEKLGDKISIPTGDARYLRSSSTSLRTKLTANTTYYVATTGNDSTGNGSSGSPWLTIQHAVNYIANSIDLAGFTATIQLADGTYTSGVVVSGPFTGNGSVVLQGNTTTPTNCNISPTSASAIYVQDGGALSIQGFNLTSSSSDSITAIFSGQVNIIGAVNFGAASNDHMNASFGGIIRRSAAYTINGGAAAHIAALNATIITSGVAATLTGTPAFSNAFAVANDGGLLYVSSDTYSGAATGTRYSANINGVINTSGGGASYFPGNSPGSTATGGLYI